MQSEDRGMPTALGAPLGQHEAGTLRLNRCRHSAKLAIRPMAPAQNRVIVCAVMNTCCPTVPLSAAPAKSPDRRGLFATLERLINTASFVSVDLTDTVFASLHEQRDRAPDSPPLLSCSE